MELSQHGFLEELLAPRRETWSSLFPSELLIPTGGWSFDSLDHQENNPNLINPSFVGFSTTPTFELCPLISDDHQPVYPFLDHGLISPVTAAENIDSSSISYTNNNNNNNNETQTTSSFLAQEDNNYYNPSSIVEQDEEDQLGGLGSTASDNNNNHQSSQVFNMGLYNNNNGDDQRKIMSKSKKLEGQPSKNLMAERRRRKRLNDRLSMLRSIVPKISKMDRTSILGDTIDYMKELLERINKLQEEETLQGHDVTNDQILMGKNNSKELKPNEVLVRNSPKFDVERREIDTRIDICCAAKPGLLLSTVSTLEAIGLEIQQCVISCFNDFSMQASCSEVGEEQRTLLSSEDIKQALFRNAGYGGRCL